MNTLEQLRSGQLIGATRLQLVEQLASFPEEIFTLADTLEVLDLSNNNLADLPDEFAQLTKLKRVFLSFNQFKHIPPVLAQCPALIMIAFKGNQISEFAENSLPVSTQWLILTDNEITQLPESFGELTQLRKLALAGNKLTTLPQSMKNCKALELVRLSANNLTQVDDWLFELPKLTWLAFAGNDFNKSQCLHNAPLNKANIDEFELISQIGEGASGIIHLAKWQQKNVAVKLFKGAITSDGYPLDEVNCCLQTGQHSNLIKVLAYSDNPAQLGLVMELISSEYQNLGLPPTLDTCTRDTFAQHTQFSITAIKSIVKQMTSTVAHLHANNVSHGDIYAHNIMVDKEPNVLFGDFGAATNLASLSDYQRQQMQYIEVRAIGCLIDDLLSVCNENEATEHLNTLAQQCMAKQVSSRPSLQTLIESL
ncbi:leucine-rich repeat domain-containing protein [Pseudoalteromonas sp. H105]|uniref:leucine-rich repeat domain-containing protein n=1 Tax=Pseudoalteromonas sp. H105 TaxID=1348393 RepID=UPI000732404D|nr:leucine-rich repeat-containing protein kinase family protein [Pseudoalteromonas sp. H105]KTF18475.1 protein kinase [Pseudoalteromonas sp. H105]